MSDYTVHTGAGMRPGERKPRVHVGLDVHKDTVAVAIAWRDFDSNSMTVEDRGSIPNRPGAIAGLTEALSGEFGGWLHCVYEAGACGFVIWRQLRDLGLGCEVVAPTLIPKKPGERVKTDRRDARELARLSVLGYLTAVWVPDTDQEAMRDLVRLRSDLKVSIKKQRQQLNHFLLRLGHQWSKTKWNKGHRAWMRDRKFQHPAQQIALVTALDTLEQHEQRLEELDRDIVAQSELWAWSPVIQSLRALRGVDHLTAVTIAAEIGDLRRFPSASQFMAFLGLVPGEFSSGSRRRTGAITKTGNSAVRRILTESAWTYRHPPRNTRHLQRKARESSEYATRRAWDAQKRLCGKYLTMCRKGKSPKTVVSAVARELAGFIWDIGCHELNRLPTATEQ